MTWKIHNKKNIFNHPWNMIEEWDIELPNGTRRPFSIKVIPEIVIVFGITHDQKILLIHQYYFIHERKAPTLVAGFVEDNDHRRTAENELREEAGCVAGDWTYLGSTYRGKYETGVAHFYLAKDVVQVGSQDLEPAEDIDVSFVSVSDFITLLKRGELQDVFPVACAYRALDHLHLL